MARWSLESKFVISVLQEAPILSLVQEALWLIVSTMAAENMLTSQKYKTLKKLSIWACQQIQQTRESSVRTWDNKQQ